jgi:phage gpG-like protein
VIKVTVKASEVQKRLRDYALRVKDTNVPNKRAAAQMQSWVTRNFNSAGKLVGGWAPLKPSTLREKRRLGYSSKPLFRTGTLRASLLAFFDERRVGVKSESPIAQYHEHGTSRMPQRRLIPSRDEARDMVLAVYEHYLSKSKKEARL